MEGALFLGVEKKHFYVTPHCGENESLFYSSTTAKESSTLLYAFLRGGGEGRKGGEYLGAIHH